MSTSIGAVAAGVTALAVTSLMPFLIGALGSFIRTELHLSAGRLGAVVAVFFLAFSVVAARAGRLVERVGARRAVVLCALLAAPPLLVVAIAKSWLVLMLAAIPGGVANAVAMTSCSLILSESVREQRHGLAYGITQSAVPVATLTAGAAVPVAVSALGWRPVFVFAALLLVPVALGAMAIDTTQTGAARPGRRSMVSRPLVTLAIAVALGTAGTIFVSTFLVQTLLEAGHSPYIAGSMLSAGSGAGIAARLLAGWYIDRQTGRHLTPAAVVLLVGCTGYIVLALAAGSAVALWLGVLAAFVGGWGWQGVLLFAVARSYPLAPASATGVIATGGAFGAVVGPLVIGRILETVSAPVAFFVAAACALLAAVLCLRGQADLPIPGPSKGHVPSTSPP